MKRSWEKEVADLDRASAYQEGYRDGWAAALRLIEEGKMVGVLNEERIRSAIVPPRDSD